MQNPKSKIQNPRSKIQGPKSKIQDAKSKIQDPKSKIQGPKSKIQDAKSKIQDPKSKIQNPNGRVWGCHIKNGYYDNPKSKILNPRSKIQNPRSKIQNPKSKIQNPKSKIQNPRSKIQNPKSKIQDPKSKIQNPKSKIQNPKSKIQNPNGPFGFWILEFGFGWPGWGGYVANALVWMGWPPKSGVVGRGPSSLAKGRGLDSPCARLKLGPDFQMVVLLETDARFPALCRGNWGPISRKMVEGCGVPSNYSMGSTSWTRAGKGNKIGCRSLLLPCPLITGRNCGCFWFLGFFLREGWWTKKDVKNFCSGKQFLMEVQSHVRLHPQIFCGYTTCCDAWGPGRRLTGASLLNPAMHKASDAGHIGPHGMRRCLSFSYRGRRHVPPTRPRRPKTVLFWRVFDVHKTSQISSKMALGRGLFGARGGISKKLNTRRKLIFYWFFDSFWRCNFSCKNLGRCKKHRKYRQKMAPRMGLELQKLLRFWLDKYLKI